MHAARRIPIKTRPPPQLPPLAEDTTAQTTPAETTHPEETRDLTVEKYDRDFVIFQAGNWGYKDFVAEDMTGEPINDAVYTMLSTVSEEFGVKFTTVNDGGKASGGQGHGYKTVETMHMSGSQEYDLTSIGCYDVCTLAYTGYLSDLASIPSSVKDVEQSGAILESLSYYGQKLVNPAYYEITLEGKTIRDEESADMLDIIFATRFFDVGFYYQVGDYGNTIFDMFYSGNTNFSSLFKASEKVVAKKLQTIDESFDKIG